MVSIFNNALITHRSLKFMSVLSRIAVALRGHDCEKLGETRSSLTVMSMHRWREKVRDREK